MRNENERPDTPQGRLDDDEELGGDPACWLHRVCPECGLFIEDRSAATCPRCENALTDL
ncbi:hypothetical protein [Tomitella fengzijianii]|uniref:hypothetical protein n=1 Tax=Tomitella fengzijianii TaxID=2597660 RepID=UPI00131BA2BE|nr:hypothetical protein [Tomitella fengzijianii]